MAESTQILKIDISEYTGPLTSAIWTLLLAADPNRQLVEAYLVGGQIFVLGSPGTPLGVGVLVEKPVWEIKNLAVTPPEQGKGYGKVLIDTMLAVAQQAGARGVEIGTGNSSFGQLAIYQKSGFRMVAIVPDFFTNYPELIYENGICCRDMVRLRYVFPDVFRLEDFP